MKRYFSLFISLLFCIVANAYKDGDPITVNGITYQFISVSKGTLRAISATTAAITDGNTIVVPPTAVDPQDAQKIYTVDAVRFYGNVLPAACTKVILSEGITKMNSLYNDASVRELYLPATLNEFTLLNQYELRKIEVAAGNTNFKFVTEEEFTGVNPGTESDGYVAGYLVSCDDTKVYYHVYPKNFNYPNNTICIPDQVTFVLSGSYYRGPSSMQTIHIGKSLQTFASDAKAPDGLKAFTVDPENTTFHADEGVLYKLISGDEYGLECYPPGKNDEKFTVWEKCTKLTNLCLQYAKMNILDLNKVQTVDYNAWRFASRLHTVVIGDDLTALYNSQEGNNFKRYVFKNDYDKVPQPSEEEMVNSTNHQNFKLVDALLLSADGKTAWAWPAGRYLVSGSNETNSVCKDYTLPAGVETVKNYAFHNARIAKFHSNPELKNIEGGSAFAYSYFTHADFGASTDLANISGLSESSILEEITISPSVTTLSSFSGCKKLASIVIPDGSKMKEFSSSTFSGLSSLKSIIFEGTCADGFSIKSDAFKNCTGLETFVFPSTIRSIYEGAFSGCSSLEHVTFQQPSTLYWIGDNAFAMCPLKKIDLPESLSEIHREAFRNCENLTEVNIPANVKTIHPEAFKFCNNLLDINVDKKNTKYSSLDGYLLSKDKETLVIFPPAKANDRFTLLPPSITKIGDYAFYSCSILKNLTIPNKVKSIGERSFGNCPNLNTITFLCDEMIDPAKINQEQNKVAFDDTMFKNITINVRQPKLTDYTENSFYQQFKAINPSFLVDKKNEYIAVSDIAVDLLAVNEGSHTYIIPQSIEHDGKQYIVSLMGDYACQNAPSSIKEIVMFNNVEYIGAKAFKQTASQTIENLFFVQANPTKQLLSTTRFELTPADLGGDDQYKEFADDMKVYVRKSAYDKCITDWASYSSMIDYKIKDAQIKTKYATFAREFDVDFSDCTDYQILAFTANCDNKGITSGSGDYGETVYHISMESIYCDDADKDGVYVPKNTGVLLKCMNADATNQNAYYCISDRNDEGLVNYAGSNVFTGITVDNKVINASAEKPIFVLQEGVFCYVYPKITPTVTMPVHKAYMQLPDAPAGAKVNLSFADGDVTSIDAIDNGAISPANNLVYNLSGQRVGKSYNGFVIKNGRKFVQK
ncbi:MAG: leucine-rich repeat domain-containing protein [Bacteroidaceae bacterium]|nr:leucine-rich repeat domain-containing protein [Bacteroidaceae bacterium]